DIIRSSSTVRPTRAAPPPQTLGRGEVGRLGATPPRAARNATVVQSTAQRTPETPSARRQPGEQRQTAAPQVGRGAEQRRGNTPPNASPPPTAQRLTGPREGRVDQRAGGRERNQPLSAAERRLRERAPVVNAPSRSPG